MIYKKQLKFTSSLVGTILLVLPLASPALAEEKNFEGLSLSIGGNAISTKTNGRAKNSDAFITSDFGKAKNLIPSIDISYSATLFSKFLLGFGGRYDLAKHKSGDLSADTTTSSVLNRIEINVGAGEDETRFTRNDIRNLESYNITYKDHNSLYVMPTYLVNDSTGIFAKAGYHQQKSTLNYKNIQTLSNTNVTTQDEEVGDSNLGPLYANNTFTTNGSRNIKGWGYGLGLKKLLTNNLFLQFEVEYVDYKSQSVVGTDGTIYKFEPESLSGTINIGYKF
jgi:opacity protein-like surface antigen